MNIYDLFPSRYITAGDLNGKSFVLTIKAVVLEDMQSHDQKRVTKPVVKFVGANKSMVLNRTNAMIIANLYGPSTDLWEGKRIEIYPTKVKAFGGMQDAIRVREHIPAQPVPVAKAEAVEVRSELDEDEDVVDQYGDEIFDTDAE